MSEDFSEYSLNELGSLSRGKSKHRPRNDPAIYGGKYPLIQTGDVKAASLHIRSHEQTYNDIGLKQSKLWDKGTLLITIAANIAETAVLDIKACFPDSIVGFIPNENIVDVYFIKYYIDYIKREMQNISQGTTQDNLSVDKLLSFRLKVPDDRNLVKKISNALLNYDLLIENNNRRIAILEEMAQSLYCEWFVKFRYPDNENNKLVESLLGLIPKGWEVKSASQVININPRTNLKADIENPFISMSCLSENSMVIDGVEFKKGNSGAKFSNRDTLFSRITPCLQNGKIGFVQFLNSEYPIGFGSTEFIVFRESERLSAEFIYLLSRTKSFRENAIQSMTGASGRQRVQNECFSAFHLAVPPAELMREFTAIVAPMFKSIYNLSERNSNLKKQRDMLLPKLISGSIEL